MKYAGFFVCCAAALGHLGSVAGVVPLIALTWPMATCCVLAAAYFTNRPGLLGKRDDGTISPRGWLLCGPWLAFSSLVFLLVRLSSRERPTDRIGSLYIGRRLVDGELPPEIEDVVDLTAELQEASSIRSRRGYVAFPILDARAVDPEELTQLVRRIPLDRPVFVHCAQGHGRTGLVAAALLVLRNEAASADEAIAMLRAARPGISLSAEQLKALKALERSPTQPTSADRS